jgi:hypothetical protein
MDFCVPTSIRSLYELARKILIYFLHSNLALAPRKKAPGYDLSSGFGNCGPIQCYLCDVRSVSAVPRTDM